MRSKKVGLQENATFSKVVVKAEKGCLSCKMREKQEKQHVEKARCLMKKAGYMLGHKKQDKKVATTFDLLK